MEKKVTSVKVTPERCGHLTDGVHTSNPLISRSPRYPGSPKLLVIPGGPHSRSFLNISHSPGLAGLVGMR